MHSISLGEAMAERGIALGRFASLPPAAPVPSYS